MQAHTSKRFVSDACEMFVLVSTEQYERNANHNQPAQSVNRPEKLELLSVKRIADIDNVQHGKGKQGHQSPKQHAVREPGHVPAQREHLQRW